MNDEVPTQTVCNWCGSPITMGSRKDKTCKPCQVMRDRLPICIQYSDHCLKYVLHRYGKAMHADLSDVSKWPRDSRGFRIDPRKSWMPLLIAISGVLGLAWVITAIVTRGGIQ